MSKRSMPRLAFPTITRRPVSANSSLPKLSNLHAISISEIDQIEAIDVMKKFKTAGGNEDKRRSGVIPEKNGSIPEISGRVRPFDGSPVFSCEILTWWVLTRGSAQAPLVPTYLPIGVVKHLKNVLALVFFKGN